MTHPIREIRPRVAQADLEMIIGLENQIRSLVRIYNRQTSAILTRLIAGAEIEAGTHTAELEEDTCGPVRATTLRVY